MASKVDSDDLYDLFQMMKGDEDTEKTSTIVINATLDYQIMEEGKLLLLELTSGIILALRYHFDHYTLIFNNDELYVLDDDKSTKMSGDRVMWYLRHLILNNEFPIED